MPTFMRFQIFSGYKSVIYVAAYSMSARRVSCRYSQVSTHSPSSQVIGKSPVGVNVSMNDCVSLVYVLPWGHAASILCSQIR